MMASLPPFGPYRVLAPLGAGGTTCLALERGAARGVRHVLKHVPGSTGPRWRLRPGFLDLLSLGHPSLALPAHLGFDGERAFYVRRYVEGAEVLAASAGKPPRRIASWMLQAAEAIAVLHAFGFSHGNLKPSNVLITASRGPETPQVVLTDPAWRAPDEDAGGPDRPAEEKEEQQQMRADLAALGRIFHRVLTGREATMLDEGAGESPRILNPEMSVDLERILAKMVHPDPGLRYASAAALADDLRRVCGPDAPPPRPPARCLVGRGPEIARAVRLLEDPSRRATIAVSGETGMGKSALLRRLALEAEALGHRTALARCYPEAGPPLAAVRTLLDLLIRPGHRGRPLRSRLRAVLEDLEAPAAPTSQGRIEREVLRILEDAVAREAGPVLLLLDDVHFADASTLSLLAALVESPETEPREGRLPSLAFTCGSEAPFRARLAPLLRAARAPDGARVSIELTALPREILADWLGRALPRSPDLAEAILASPDLGGRPYAVEEAIRLGSSPASVPAQGKGLLEIHDLYLRTLAPEARAILDTLAVLGRPASPGLLAALSKRTESPLEKSLEKCLAALVEDGTLREEAGSYFFHHASFRSWVRESLPDGAAARLHGAAARTLEAMPETSPEEIAEHWMRSDAPAEGARTVLDAARRLARRQEFRGALRFYAALSELIPPADEILRRCVAEEAAEAHACAGDLRRAEEILEGLLASGPAGLDAARLHGRLGACYHRSGDVAQAVRHLEESLKILANIPGVEELRVRLRAESELAEIAIHAGDHRRAEEICRQGLDELDAHKGETSDAEVRREEMVLLETLAHLRMRSFRYEEARDLFERSLEAGAPLGPVRERSLILNNLGTLHAQESKFHDAIDAYRRAETLSREIADDETLAVILSNLALLHAKVGDPDAADDALRRAAAHEARCDSRRTRLVRLHNAGLVDLLIGRYAAALDALHGALGLAEELKELFMAAFDLVYVAECRLFRGEMKAARASLDRATAGGEGAPSPVRAMAEARRAVLAALRGEREGAEAAWKARSPREQGIPYLEAWNGVFFGWSRRLLRDPDGARLELEASRHTFETMRVPAGEVHARLELAALEADAGHLERAEKGLRSIRERWPLGQGALRSPMLSARLLLYEARVALDRRKPDAGRAASLVAEAEGFLIGRRLGELEGLVRELRRKLRAASPTARPFLAPPSAQPGVPDLVATVRDAALDFVRAAERVVGDEPATALGRQLRELEDRLHEVQQSAEKEPAAGARPVTADSLRGGSRAIRGLVDVIRSAARCSLPVLVAGETGTGKELVARAIHGESRAGPFVSVNCAALPAELLEAELFGFRKGAFTGAEEDRPGLLSRASGGSFFFDEIGDMPLALQAKLLRVLDSRRVRPLGGDDEVAVDARFLFATNRDLASLVEEGKFRRDLYFRIRAMEIRVPSLRERPEDIPELAEHFRIQAAGPESEAFFEESALRALQSHPWPGNVRELENVVTRLALTCAGRIGEVDVRRVLGAAPEGGLFSPALLRSRSLEDLQVQLEREFLLQLHADSGRDLKRMAKSLGITRRALYDRFRRTGIDPRSLR